MKRLRPFWQVGVAQFCTFFPIISVLCSSRCLFSVLNLSNLTCINIYSLPNFCCESTNSNCRIQLQQSAFASGTGVFPRGLSGFRRNPKSLLLSSLGPCKSACVRECASVFWVKIGANLTFSLTADHKREVRIHCQIRKSSSKLDLRA